MLQAFGLHKVYNHGAKALCVLKGINIEVNPGDFLCIVGPSGAGKSTLLHLLGGLDRPTEGRVIFDGTDLNTVSDKELSFIRNKRFGFVFQFYHLLSEFNVLENVMLPELVSSKTSSSRTELKNRAEDLLESVGLGDRKEHFPNELSGGEQQRVAIARALINNPEIIFSDEPTGNLDSESGRNIIEILQSLNKEKKTTMVVVTHNQDLAKIAQSVLYLRDGNILKLEGQ